MQCFPRQRTCLLSMKPGGTLSLSHPIICVSLLNHDSHFSVFRVPGRTAQTPYRSINTRAFPEAAHCGHTIALQWTGILGVVLPVQAATLDHAQAASICSRVTKIDPARLVKPIGADASALLGTHPGYHHKHLYPFRSKNEI